MRLPEYVIKVMNTITGEGFEAYAVGGCVRDGLLGKVPHDWDITTNALPNDIVTIFGSENTVSVGIQHGTVGVKTAKGLVEVTTYRIDGSYSDFRHPDCVEFSPNLADDLKRRDFTVNAMAYNPRDGLIDMYGGKSDLKHKTLRAVGNPVRRFHEDSLRIMRGLRFSATLGFKIEDNTKAAILDCCPLLKNIALERITSEFLQLISADNPQNVLLEYVEVFELILDQKLDQWKLWAPRLTACPKDEALRLAVLFQDGSLPHCLLLPGGIKKDFRLVVENKDTEILPNKIGIKRILSCIDTHGFELLLRFKRATDDADLSIIQNIYNDIIDNGECFSLARLAVSGGEINEFTGLKGKEIGAALGFLLNAVIEEKCKNDKEALIKFIKTNH